MVTLETTIAMAPKFWPASMTFLIQTGNLVSPSNTFVQRPINIFSNICLKSYYICISTFCLRLKYFTSLKSCLQLKQRN
jgi:hypothetical protein